MIEAIFWIGIRSENGVFLEDFPEVSGGFAGQKSGCWGAEVELRKWGSAGEVLFIMASQDIGVQVIWLPIQGFVFAFWRDCREGAEKEGFGRGYWCPAGRRKAEGAKL